MSGGATEEDRIVHVGDGLDLHAAVCGHGPPLLLLHGFTGSAEAWQPLRDALADRRTMIAVDLPGHGRSSAPADPARYALPRLADDLARLLDSLQVERALVLGYSMGGRAALHLALAHQARVSALILESSSAGIDDPAERSARASADAALADAIERDGIQAFVERWEALPLWASQASLPPAVQRSLREQRLRNRPAGLANSLRGAGAGVAPPMQAALGSLQVPALLIAGALDAKYVALGQSMARSMPRAELVVIPEAGHAAHLEQPARFAAEVRAFLSRVTAAAGEDNFTRASAGE